MNAALPVENSVTGSWPPVASVLGATVLLLIARSSRFLYCGRNSPVMVLGHSSQALPDFFSS